MPRTVTIFTVWASSAGDAQKERNCLSDVVDTVNQEVAARLGLRLELKRWEDIVQPLPVVGQQQNFDTSTPISENDIFVGILRNRFGTPLPEPYGKMRGLEYEFKVALDSFRRAGTPHVLIYASKAPVDVHSVNLDQLRRLVEFKRSLMAETILHEFGDENEFAREVQQDLARFLAKWAAQHGTPSSPEPISIFISYARCDAELVTSLASHFAVAGIRPWYDTSQLTGGDDWVKRIADAIEEAHVFLLVASQSTLNSTWVRREIDFAVNRGKQIIPVEIGQVKWPNWFDLQLGSLQRLRLDNATSQAQVERLVSAIRAARST